LIAELKKLYALKRKIDYLIPITNTLKNDLSGCGPQNISWCHKCHQNVLTTAPFSPPFFRHRRRSARKQVIRPRAHNPTLRTHHIPSLAINKKFLGQMSKEFFWVQGQDLNLRPFGLWCPKHFLVP